MNQTAAEVLYETQDKIATITLHRPERLNAWTPTMDALVREYMEQATNDDGVRVIILTGAGRGFCSGADMGTLQNIQGGERVESKSGIPPKRGPVKGGLQNLPEGFSNFYAYFPTVPKPVICAINGPAAGLGFILPLFADFRFAADSAVFTTSFAMRGLIAEHGVSWMLPRVVGLPTALDLLLSARKIDAAEALRLGLVHQVFPGETLLEEARNYARHLADNVSPRSLRIMKEQLYTTQFQSLDEAMDVANQAMVDSFPTEDFAEGVAHFVEKRKANFTGK